MLNLRILVLVVCLTKAAPDVLGQNLSIGVIGGGSLTDSFSTQTAPAGPVSIVGYSQSKDYIAGATVELKFLPQWSVEVDGLFRELHFTTASFVPGGSLTTISPSPVITWEFPLLAKYRFDVWKAKPFVELGPSFRTAGNLNGTNPSHVGATAGFGVAIQARKLRIEPVLRYTRWMPDGVSPFPAKSNPDQLELLVGFSAAPESKWQPLGSRFSVGLVAGVNLTDALQPQNINLGPFVESTQPVRSFIVGPTVVLSLYNHLSVEADALYHPLRAEYTTVINGIMQPHYQSSIATWELPVLARYTFSMPLVNPVLEAGPSFRLPSAGLSNYGATAGLGLEAHFHLLRIAPVVRFTHWAPDSITASARTLQNQVEFLVRFSL
jgi:hypothetical protein